MKANLVVGYLILAILALAATAALLALLPWKVWAGDEKLAAWVQAVGSVVAILVAAIVPALQHAAVTRTAAKQVAATRRTQKALLRTLSTEACALLERLRHVINLERTFGMRQAFPDQQMLFWRNLHVKVDFAYVESESAELLGSLAHFLATAESLYRRNDGAVVATQETNSLDALLAKATTVHNALQ